MCKKPHKVFLNGRSISVRSLWLTLLVCWWIPATAGFAVEENTTVKEPTIITSQTLTTDNKAKTALFQGNVVAKKGDGTLYADKMLVHYSEEKGGSSIKRIDTEGNVRLVRGDRVVTSKFATYFAEPEEHIIFTGEPRAAEGENVVTGTKITYFMKDDRSIVENSKVFIVNKQKS